ncbi:hypothetical protein EXW72_07825 [Pseudomonas sp. BCA14]|nr:hypothetical protein EXW70_04665 [Pseudomonas sp. JMN1]TFF15498.1 hypothetical protein EXW71_04375 [Pseudomonas sp. BCA17]TFF31905.1 hypothetical protein EXW72_07825 [Pseudomonas sp. BCA14]TFF32858.1 hypothetical protein EXW73_03625 [Pseudomonas sp. BCA13]
MKGDFGSPGACAAWFEREREINRLRERDLDAAAGLSVQSGEGLSSESESGAAPRADYFEPMASVPRVTSAIAVSSSLNFRALK